MPLAHPRLARVLLPLLLGSALWCSALAPGQQPLAPKKSLPSAQRPAAMMSIAGAPLSATPDTVATIQARLDACPPGEAVEVRGTIRLDRPLVLSRDRVSLVGAPKAVLMPTGAFPAIIAGPPPARPYPGWPGRQRVDVSASTDGTLTRGLVLSGGVLRLPGSAFESVAGLRQMTVAAIAVRTGASWGQNDTAPLIVTDPNRATADPLGLKLKPLQVAFSFRTSDGVSRRAIFRRPADLPTARIMILLDLDAGRVGAYLDGAYAAADLSGIGPGWGPGLAMARGEFPDFQCGRDPGSSGQGAFVLAGLRVGSRVEATLDVPVGTTLKAGFNGVRPTDRNLYGPSLRSFDAGLDLEASPLDGDDPLVWYNYRATKRGCGMVTPVAWGVNDTVGELEVRDLTIAQPDRDYGCGFEIGITRNLRLRDLMITGGARGVSQHAVAVSYPLYIDGLWFASNADVALSLGRGIVHADRLTFDRGPAGAQIRIIESGGSISRFFMAQHPMPACITIKNFAYTLTLRDGCINYEGFGPEAYIRVRREQVGLDKTALLLIESVEVGSKPAKVAVVDLLDPYWNGRMDKIGRTAVETRGSFTILDPGAVMFRGVSPAWGASRDGVKVEPVKVPVPDPVPGPVPGPLGNDPVTPKAMP